MNNRVVRSEENTYIMSPGTPFQFNEAFKNLRANLRYTSVDGNVQKIIVTSAIAGEGKSTISINLAISLSQLSHRTLIIDADLRNPKIHKYLKLVNTQKRGLTTALAGLQSIDDSIVFLEEYGIYVMPSGPAVPNPTELLQSKMMYSLIDKLSSNFEFIIIDTPPISIVSDALVLTPLSDGVIFVIRQGYAPADIVQEAKNCMEHARMRVLGCVLNVFNSSRSNRYSTSSYYYKQYSKRDNVKPVV